MTKERAAWWHQPRNPGASGPDRAGSQNFRIGHKRSGDPGRTDKNVLIRVVRGYGLIGAVMRDFSDGGEAAHPWPH